MTPIELQEWSFPSGVGVTLCALNERVEVLAERLGVALQAWEEDGLGPTLGFALKVSDTSGVWVKAFGGDHPQFPGPVVEVDAREAATRGFHDLMAEVAAAVRLQPGATSWRPANPADWQADARHLEELALSRRP